MNADFLNVETINEINSRLNSEIQKLDEQFNKQVKKYLKLIKENNSLNLAIYIIYYLCNITIYLKLY